MNLHGDLAGARAEHKAFHADEVAEVQVFLEEVVVHRLVLAGGDVVAADVDLLVAFPIAQHRERGLAHDADAHQTAGQGDVLLRRIILEAGRDAFARCGNREFRRRERLDPEVTDLLKGSPAVGLLFAQSLCHLLINGREDTGAAMPRRIEKEGPRYYSITTTRRVPSREMLSNVLLSAGRPKTSYIGSDLSAGRELNSVNPVARLDM